jgi:uncharacterized protein (DUF2141 family)
MKKKYFLFCVLLYLSFNTLIAQEKETYNLTITVEGLRNSKGVLQFAIYTAKGSIPDENFKRYYKKHVVSIISNTAGYTFENLPKGNYAINILHDENEDGKIGKRFILPTEGIGFSNYTSIGISNRPKFEKTKFELSRNLEKTIKIIYL